MQAKANYYGCLSHMIGLAQLAGPDALLQSARCTLQAARGEGRGRGRGRRKGGEVGHRTVWRWGWGGVRWGASVGAALPAPCRAAGYAQRR